MQNFIFKTLKVSRSKKIVYWFASIAIFFTLTCCDEIFIKDLETESILLTFPGNGSESEALIQIFRWEAVDEAVNYNFQLVSPSFDSVKVFIQDTVTFLTSYKTKISPGKYEWRVRALNSVSRTHFTTFKLTVDSTIEKSGQVIIHSR